MDMEFQFGKTKNFWRGMVVMFANNVNALNATELYTQKQLER